MILITGISLSTLYHFNSHLYYNIHILLLLLFIYKNPIKKKYSEVRYINNKVMATSKIKIIIKINCLEMSLLKCSVHKIIVE